MRCLTLIDLLEAKNNGHFVKIHPDYPYQNTRVENFIKRPLCIQDIFRFEIHFVDFRGNKDYLLIDAGGFGFSILGGTKKYPAFALYSGVEESVSKNNDGNFVPKNNDGRDVCYWCGAPCKQVRGVTNIYSICTKCGK